MTHCATCPTPISTRNKSGLCRTCVISAVPKDDWTEEQLAIMHRDYAAKGARALSEITGRSYHSVLSKAKKLGLRLAPGTHGAIASRNLKRTWAQRRANRPAQEPVTTAAQFSARKRKLNATARAKVASGVTSSDGRNMVEKMALRNAQEEMAAEQRQNCPVEQAKIVLRAERIMPVVSMAFTDRGGPTNLYQIGQAINVTEQDLLALADRVRARRAA